MSDTTRITVYGASDDLVEIEGDIEGADEYDITGDDSWQGVLVAPDGATARLYVDYRDNATWTISLGQWEEDYQLPAWPMVVVTDFDKSRYSAVAHITVPVGTRLNPLIDLDDE